MVTIFYIIGRPRSGSTIVGDLLAQKLNVLNAGEVWQTFRSLGYFGSKSSGKWQISSNRTKKNKQIQKEIFWQKVIKNIDNGPYASLCSQASKSWPAFVDTSKNEFGIKFYEDLGCKIILIHTQRSFSSWSKSINSYRAKYDLRKVNMFKLLYNYIFLNRRYAKYNKEHEYYFVRQEELKGFIQHLKGEQIISNDNKYYNAEMFGTSNFIGDFDEERATTTLNLFDRLCYFLIGNSKINSYRRLKIGNIT